MRHFVNVLCACTASLFAMSGCMPGPDPKADGPFKIEGRVVLSTKLLPSIYSADNHPNLDKAISAPGAKVFLSADRDGEKPLSAIALTGSDGAFSLTVDGRLRDYWLIVEHPNGIAMRTNFYNMHAPSNDNIVISLQPLKTETSPNK